ncbi:sigma-70 family RNA polymerase sigma factor [Clostridiales bacterium COT073_COT-073]|nr:sigma-70 family RNA polymerase sigma factor [Clostridiales bacterium COT073_COT-073]
MNDEQIVELYWERKEIAIVETAAKYGSYLSSISYNILANHEDASECVNDTYHAAWNTMPPHRPTLLSAFLGKITRRISIDCWRKYQAEKRGGGEMALVLEELEDCVAGSNNVEKEMESREWVRWFNDFLKSLPETERRVFLCRYWYMDSIKAISEQFGFSQSKVMSMLHRTRGKLRAQLIKEGF